jgi:hypothetical protein
MGVWGNKFCDTWPTGLYCESVNRARAESLSTLEGGRRLGYGRVVGTSGDVRVIVSQPHGAQFMCTAALKRCLRVAALAAFLGCLDGPIAMGQMRTWIDSSGKHRVQAELIGVAGKNVLLRNAAGKQLTVPIVRLSLDDQGFIRQQPSGSDAKPAQAAATSAPVGPPAEAKPVAKRFFTALIDQDFDEIKSLLTPAGQANWDAAKTLIEGLDVPDSRRSVLVRTAKSEAELAEVNVSVKVRGKYLKQRLKFRWSDNQWLVAALIPDGDEDESINFEPVGDDRSNSQLVRRNRTADMDDDSDGAESDDDAPTDDDEDDES